MCVVLPGGVGHGVEGVLDGVHVGGEPREQRHDLLSLLLLPHPHVRIRPGHTIVRHASDV